MPTREPIVDTVIPKDVTPPIPVRVVSTRSTPKPSPQTLNPENRDQTLTNRSEPAAESVQTAESVRLSPQLSALARKEQAHRQRELAFKEREKQFETKLALAEKYEQLKAKFASKDFSEAETLGLDHEGYTQYVLNKLNGEKPENQALKKLEDEVSGLKKAQEESATKQYEETVAEYKKEIASFVSSKPEYEGLKDPDIQAGMLQAILDAFEKDDIELSIEEAAKFAKEALAERAKKLQVFLEKEEPEFKPLPPPQKTGLKTLTQQVTTGPNTSPQKSLQFLPENERYAEARRRALMKLEAQK